MLIAASGDLGVIVFLLIATALYFLPTIVAVVRSHHQVGAIIVIDVLLGWTLIGWVVALAMAFSAVRPAPQPGR